MRMNTPYHTERRKVKRVKCSIIARRFYRTSSHPNNAADSVFVFLSCGHTKRYKGSQEPKTNVAYCEECARQ
jgi:hypothetical protein